MSGKFRFPHYGWLGLALLAVSEILLCFRVEMVTEWFYLFAWWPYILVVDGLVYRRKGTSLLTRRLREFALLLPSSVCLWLVFELFNLALNNWYYVAVPENLPLRWAGYTLSYATVLPGLFETMELLDAYQLFSGSAVRPLSSSTSWYLASAATGVLFLVLPLIWPQYCFPLVWGGFIFLLEPVNHRLGGHSLVRQWQQGSLRTFYLLLTAGAICGLLWEFWNYWALTKWIYTVPYVGWLKVFEMPLLGFLGFPPFAVECYVVMNTVSLFRQGRTWEEAKPLPARRRPFRASLIGLGVLAYCLFAFHQIDLHTVATWRP